MKSPKEIAKSSRVMVLGDCHFPYHDKRAWSLALEIVNYFQPDCVVQIGDLCDSLSVNSHGRRFGESASLEDELEATQEQWQLLESAVPESLLAFTTGNHDVWLERLVAKTPALEGLVKDIKERYGMSEDVIVKSYQEPFVIGKVRYVHDIGYSGKYAAHQTLDAVQHCLAFGHTHRAGLVYSGDTSGNRWFALNVGWLGDPRHIKYMAPAKLKDWQHGIGIVDYRDNVAYATFVPFVRGRALVDGRVFK